MRRRAKPRRNIPRAWRVEPSARQQAIDVAARALLVSHDPATLRTLAGHLRSVCDEADRVAQETPSPPALETYRRAARSLAEAERALALADVEMAR